MAKSTELTPMLRHYMEVKARHPDAILFYRMGDFFELFFEDAIEAAPILEVTLTARHKGKESEAPMCGVPHHAVESYIGKLVERGYRVAICDQVEDPAEAKGLVRREVTRVVTPGTLSDPRLLDGRSSSVVAAVEWDEGKAAGAGAFLEVATGRFFVVRWDDEEAALEDLRLHEPRELLLPDQGTAPALRDWAERRDLCVTVLGDSRSLSGRAARRLLEEHLEVGTLRGFGLEPEEGAVRAAAHALSYARDTQGSELAHVRELELRPAERGLVLDATTLANLEVFRNVRDGSERGTLRSVVDRTRTAAGSRLLTGWLREPLRRPEPLAARFDAVGELVERAELRARVRSLLDHVGDVERLLARASLDTLTPREAAALRDTLRTVPELQEALTEARSELLVEVAAIDPAAELRSSLERRLEEEPAANLARGGVIAAGVDEELDACRSLARDSKQHIMALQAGERERTGIQSLKVRFNKVFGYYIEVTKANLDAVPDDYERKQTLVNAERFITPELKEIEEKILTAEERQLTLEAELFAALRAEIAARGEVLGRLGRSLARLDVLADFAELAETHRYVRPEVLAAGGPIDIREGRHPVVERLGEEAFVPNDVLLDEEEARIVVLTGPNMGGKSTYLRQVALIVLLAQAGSFVPAETARLGLVDRIFTRVGASDDLTRGESTFMVEMIETANILRFATAESLVILDEVGRGTATFDGLSLAWAIVEHLARQVGAKTLFATHYHELTELASVLPGVVNRTMLVKEWEGRIVFLRRVVPGQADESYGIHVARLAGLPEAVLERAREILDNLERQEYDLKGEPRLAKSAEGGAPDGPGQLNLFAPPEEIVAAVLRDVDLERLSPVAALNLLVSLKRRLGGR